MRKVGSYEALEPLLCEQLRPGVRTNCAMDREELAREIGAGTLYARRWAGGLALLCRRTWGDRMFFYLTEPSEPWTGGFPRDTVVEMPRRRTDGALEEAGVFWEAAGFRRVLERLRLTREAGPWAGAAPDGGAELAGPADVDAVRALLEENFSPYTGWLPGGEELDRALRAGEILCVRDGTGRAAGVLHFVRRPWETELRHLAVRQDLRRQGAARRLIAGYLAMAGDMRSRVWAGADNGPALALYRQCGYAPDGWCSTVLLYRDRQNEKGRTI